MKLSLPANLKNKRAISWYRVSIASFYFVQGLIFASWASRIPDIKHALNMNEAVFATALFFIPAGQTVGMAISGWLINKIGSKKILLLAALLYPLGLVFLGMAPSVAYLSMALFFFGIGSNFFNISINTQAVGIERLYRRSIMSSFHGLWSLAGFFAGLISTFMVAIHVEPLVHFYIIFLFSLLVMSIMGRSILPRDEQQGSSKAVPPKEKKKVWVVPDKYVLILGIIAFGSMICEGTVFNWSNVYFEEVVDPPQNLIRMGYIAAMFSMAAGRFVADAMITRFGVVKVLRVCGGAIVAGMLTVSFFPYLISATLGFFVVGIGISSIIPITYSLAGKSKIMVPSIAIATVASVAFFGFVIGPPAVGYIAHLLDLRIAFGIVAIMGLFIFLLASRVK